MTDPATTPDPAEDVAHQPTLAGLELPDYHGRQPIAMRTGLTGAGTRITRPHTIGDRIVLIIEARVKTAGHEDTDDGLVYTEKAKVLDLYELDPEQGSRLLSTVRSIYRTGEDALRGRKPVDGLGDVGYTDASGVVLTPEEVAEIRGDPVRAILSPELDPAVVVYDDGSRDLWPDDYAKDRPRPKLGQVFEPRDENGAPVRVVELLHHETGEPLATVEAETPPTLAAVPDPPDGDPFAGDLGDAAADQWETPDPRTPSQIAADEAEREALLPTSADRTIAARPVRLLRDELAMLSDLAQLRRILKAEQQSVNRRRTALAAIEERIAQLEATP